MSEQELNEYLAEEIMGWEYLGRHSEQGEEPQAWYKTDNGKRTHWNPLENLEQTFECLEEYTESYVFSRLCGNYCLYGLELGPHQYSHREKSKCIAGCILKAESKFEEFEEVFN